MGMYDEVRFVPGKTPLPRCVDGHFMDDFQTKDLACTLNRYYVVRDRLYVLQHTGSWSEEHIEQHGDRIEIARTSHAQFFAPGIREINIYNPCNDCMPVLVEGETWSGDNLREESPWVQYTLRMSDDGHIAEMILDQKRSTSREQLRAKFPGAVPDDDRVAQRHFEKLRAQRDLKKSKAP